MIASRRSVLRGAAIAASALAAGAARAQWIPQRPIVRVIMDNDFAGDPDGLVALAHQLLTPTSRSVLVTVSQLDAKFVAPDLKPDLGIAKGIEQAKQVIARLAQDHPPVAGGTEAVRAIVAEAMREDALPLFFACGGPLTNLAAALAIEPRIASRMTLVWIGGGGYPDGGWEYNLAVDPDAARTVIERSAIPVWQVPQPAYRQMQLSIAEMRTELYPISDFTHWLYAQFTHPPDFVKLDGAWPMGDSPLVLLTAISAESSASRMLPARAIRPDLRYGDPIPGRTIRVFERLDARLCHADFLAKLKLHASGS